MVSAIAVIGALCIAGIFLWLLYTGLRMRARFDIERDAGERLPKRNPTTPYSSQMRAELFVETFRTKRNKRGP